MRVRVFETYDPNIDPPIWLGAVRDIDLEQEESDPKHIMQLLSLLFPGSRLLAFNYQDNELPGWEAVTEANAKNLPAFLAHRRQIKAVRRVMEGIVVNIRGNNMVVATEKLRGCVVVKDAIVGLQTIDAIYVGKLTKEGNDDALLGDVPLLPGGVYNLHLQRNTGLSNFHRGADDVCKHSVRRRSPSALSAGWSSTTLGYLHGASFDTNGAMSPLEGSSPGAHHSISPMSWAQSFEGNRLMNRHMQPLVVHTAD